MSGFRSSLCEDFPLRETLALYEERGGIFSADPPLDMTFKLTGVDLHCVSLHCKVRVLPSLTMQCILKVKSIGP